MNMLHLIVPVVGDFFTDYKANSIMPGLEAH